MSNRYDGLSPKQADDLMIGTIGLLVADAMDEARAMTRKEWDERDMDHQPHYFASAIFYAVQNRLRSAP
ncbi:hypothetical protein [Agrobacterium tumefaciens]|uniref:hypothetical protein n=1 Tax=Agrobacterium tumefaciens TaxID=358 RepID=UPI0009760E9C|nr:hypothetical protein BV900_02455 [Agrobacterium tumefaciens]